MSTASASPKRAATQRTRRTTASTRRKVTKERVDRFYAAPGLAGLSTLPAVYPTESGANCVMTADSGV